MLDDERVVTPVDELRSLGVAVMLDPNDNYTVTFGNKDNLAEILGLLDEVPNLTVLFIDHVTITPENISAISELPTLVSVGFYDCELSDLSGIENLTELTGFTLSNVAVSDLTPLASLTKLKDVTLNGTQVTDLSPLAGQQNLTNLSISDTQISDLTPLTGVPLEFLFMPNTAVADISPLMEITTLKLVELRDVEGRISPEAIEAFRQALPDCNLLVD